MNTPRIKPGSRVSATLHGERKVGTVVCIGPLSRAIVWVRWDGAHRETWLHAASLLPA